MSICFLLSPFYQAPSCFRAILCKPIGLITPGLSVLIAVLVGQGLNYFPVTSMNHMEKMCDNQPKSHCKPYPATVVYSNTLWWVDLNTQDKPRKWVGVCSKESKGQMCFSAGFTFQGVTFWDLFCGLPMLFEATVLCFSLMSTMCLGTWSHICHLFYLLQSAVTLFTSSCRYFLN